jgi:hypothetical protein
MLEAQNMNQWLGFVNTVMEIRVAEGNLIPREGFLSIDLVVGSGAMLLLPVRFM